MISSVYASCLLHCKRAPKTEGQRMNKSLVRKDFRQEACVVHAVSHLPADAVR